MFTLIALGIGVAWIYSVLATFLPQIFPLLMRDENDKVAVYFEAAAVITSLVLLGQVLELRARSQTSDLLMRAERVGSDTLLSQIVRMVSEAQRSRAPIHKLAEWLPVILSPP